MPEGKSCESCKDKNDKRGCPWFGTGDDCDNFPDKIKPKEPPKQDTREGYEEKRRLIFNDMKNREIGEDGRMYAKTLNGCGIDQLEQIALAEGYKRGLEMAGKIVENIVDELSPVETNKDALGFPDGYDRQNEIDPDTLLEKVSSAIENEIKESGK